MYRWLFIFFRLREVWGFICTNVTIRKINVLPLLLWTLRVLTLAYAKLQKPLNLPNEPQKTPRLALAPIRQNKILLQCFSEFGWHYSSGNLTYFSLIPKLPFFFLKFSILLTHHSPLVVVNLPNISLTHSPKPFSFAFFQNLQTQTKSFTQKPSNNPPNFSFANNAWILAAIN